MAEIQTNLQFVNGFVMNVQGLTNTLFHLTRMSFPGMNIGTTNVSNSSVLYLTEPGDKMAYDDLIITLNIDEDLSNWKEIYSWMRRAAETKDDYRDITITTLSNKKNHNINFKFLRVYPYSMSPINFDYAAQPDMPIQTDVIFKFVDISY